MAANTFEEITRSLRLYVPQLPIPLAEQFIRDKYRKILERRDWSGLRREAEFHLNDQKLNGTVSVVRNSPTVTGIGTTFDVGDVGRQFKIGVGSSIYTIVAIDFNSQTLTLDRSMGVATGTNQSYRIIDAFVTPPADFLRFLTISDPLMGWRLRWWITADELNSMDPQRNFFGQPYILADRLYNVATVAPGEQPRPQFEAWPYSTSARTLYYMYIQRGADLVNDSDMPIWPIRSDIIVKGALADVARWPGTAQSPNPYFSRPDWWKTYDAEFEDMMIELERRDEEVYMTMLETVPYNSLPFAPLSANWLQTHAIS